MTSTEKPRIKVVLHPAGPGIFHAFYGETMLCEKSGDPEHDAARVLLLLGIDGYIETWHHGAPFPALIFKRDVAWVAAHQTTETKSRPRTRRMAQADYEAAMARARAFLGFDAPAT